MTINIKMPSNCSINEIREFASLVIKGGEVLQNGLVKRIQNASLLGFATENGLIVSVAAIKQPSQKYRHNVFKESGSCLFPGDYVLEYGWAFTEESYRGRGFARTLLTKLLTNVKNQTLWATTRETNSRIHTILKKYGFQRTGHSFRGRNDNLILWTKGRKNPD